MYYILNATESLDAINHFNLDQSIYWQRGKNGESQPDPESCTGVYRYEPDNTTTAIFKANHDRYRLRKCRRVPGTELNDERHWDLVQLVCHHHVTGFMQDNAAAGGKFTEKYSIVIAMLGM